MRYEQILAKDSYTKVEVGAVWPSSSLVAPPSVADAEGSQADTPFVATAAAPDVPASVGKMIIGSYVALISAFALATVASSYSVYMITISMLFLVAFFSVPWLFLRQQAGQVRLPTLQRFMNEGMKTLTGHSTGAEALIQMMIVPVSLTFGVMLMGLAVAIIF